MPDHHTSSAAIVDAKGKLIGIITEQDIIEKAIAKRRNIDNTTAEQIMTLNPITISIDAPFTEALQLMTQNGFGTLPVMDGSKLVGIVDIRDLYDSLNVILEAEMNLKDGLIAYAYGDDSYGIG